MKEENYKEFEEFKDMVEREIIRRLDVLSILVNLELLTDFERYVHLSWLDRWMKTCGAASV